ncbi:MAG: type I glyceraldehyde-3-phosphate dehydrogenase [Patescibacteria group bacterium]
MSTKIAINGFGRIGRAAFKIALAKKNLKVMAINDLMSPDVMAYLLKYDTVYGRYTGEVEEDKLGIKVNGKSYLVTAEKEPAKLPWKKLGVEVVLECSGRFADKESASAHLKAGAKKVIISAIAKGGVPMYLLGVNVKGKIKDDIISNASCTSNCVGPVAQVMVSAFGVEKAMMTTIHSYTAEQNLVDGPPPALHKDMHRARAAAHNIAPTTTGAAITTTEVVPELKGLFDGLSVRVPTICVSLSDLTFVLKKNVTKEQVNQAIVKASKTSRYQGILEVTDQPLVSSDFIGNPSSVTVDLSLTQVVGGNLVKVVGWYDNEWGYANRLVEMIDLVK